MPRWTPELKTHPCVTKHPTPILTKDDIPYEASLIFNAGVAKIDGKYVMVFRNDYGVTREEFEAGGRNFIGTSVGVAVSDNGVDNWQVAKTPIIDYRMATIFFPVGKSQRGFGGAYLSGCRKCSHHPFAPNPFGQ